MTEERATYTAGRPTHKLAITLTVDVDDEHIAGYLAGAISANPMTRERGADPLGLDYALLDFLLDAVAPEYPPGHFDAEGVDFDPNGRVEVYQAREWLRNYRLSLVRE
jgi:hypothetical protein